MNPTQWLETIAAWIWQASRQASVLVVLVFLVQWLFGKKLAPSWRYGFWLLVVARLVLPVSPQSPLSIFNWVRVAPVSKPAFTFALPNRPAGDAENRSDSTGAPPVLANRETVVNVPLAS